MTTRFFGLNDNCLKNGHDDTHCNDDDDTTDDDVAHIRLC